LNAGHTLSLTIVVVVVVSAEEVQVQTLLHRKIDLTLTWIPGMDRDKAMMEVTRPRVLQISLPL
jgi:hypothetical protein